MKKLFVAATRQNDGKTTVSLGLFNAFRKQLKSLSLMLAMLWDIIAAAVRLQFVTIGCCGVFWVGLAGSALVVTRLGYDNASKFDRLMRRDGAGETWR